VVQNTVALPTPYHYTLIEVARTFNATDLGAPSLHPLYTESMSNLVPAERIHEYWDRKRESRYRREHGERIEETNRKKIYALGLVVASLERHLRGQLSRLSAPYLPTPPQRTIGLSPEGYLWTEFTQLNAAVQSLDVHRVRAMPPHEREARFRSARLVRRLRGEERLSALGSLASGVPGGITPGPNLLVYQLHPDSTEFNARPGDFGYALSPRGTAGFLDQHPFLVTQGTNIRVWRADTIEQAHLTEVTIEAIDRTNAFIALRLGNRNALRTLARRARDRTTGALLDFDHDVVLDPVHQDYLTSKVRLTLAGIGNPPVARLDDRTLEALGLDRNTPAGNAPVRPAAEVLWEAQRLAGESTGRDVVSLRGHLEPSLAARGRILMPDQWAAWEAGLRQRLTLVWGPPGTGKSFTLRALIQGAVLDAFNHGKSLRLLITAHTYPAVDNLLLRLQDELHDLIQTNGERPYRLVRVQSGYRSVEHDFTTAYAAVENIELNRARPSPAALALRNSLERPSPTEILIVGAPAQQMYNLATAGFKNPTAKHTQREWFDLMIIDEASQLDVATSTIIFSTRAREGACVLAGDDLQLPPIHQAVPPEGLESTVGSVYNYIRQRQEIGPVPLNASFRSNATLIEFTRAAGYDAHLYAHSPALKIRHDVPGSRPADWPDQLPWSDDYHRLLDPEHPAVCVVYDDRMSAQSNPFEADAIAALVWLLRNHLYRGLANELDPYGSTIPLGEPAERFAGPEFWRRGIGVVAPHRAQMSLIAGRLQALFPSDPATQVRGAVDTVERFQGQERDVILASFGLGDPDVIAAEEEFLYNLRRFNVMASRARAKLIVFVTRSMIEHLSDDSEILNESLLIKRYAEQFCRPTGIVRIGEVEGELRWR
jgi:DNA replication ATP-dependent helicase Dna2